MALFANPDFTTMDLRETPDQNKDDWKRQFEASSGAAYDDLVKRFTGQEVPATGVSIGVDRLLSALRAKGRIGAPAQGPALPLA